MTLIYALSGIALNHRDDWNPSYDVSHQSVQWYPPPGPEVTKPQVLAFLDEYGERENFKKYYYPSPGQLKVFLKGGSIQLDMATGLGVLEHLKKRPIFFEVNYLHYNPKGWWTWFSDIFCAALMLLALTGMFVLKGRKGITGRGAWLTGIGIIIPIGFLIFYL